MRRHVSVTQAYDIITRLLTGGPVALRIPVLEDSSQFQAELSAYGVEVVSLTAP